MPLKILELDPLHLSYPPDNLRLSVKSSAVFKFPDGMRVSLPELDIAKALISGSIWVGHARVCPIDIYISYNDKPLDAANRPRVLESLGSRILDSNLWPQLSLSTCLEFPPVDGLKELQADLSLLLSHDSSTTASTPRPRGWALDNIDIDPPASVPRVQFQKLEVRLDFHTSPEERSSPAKRPKICEQEPTSMLLDQFQNIDQTNIESLQQDTEKLEQQFPMLINQHLGQQEMPYQKWDMSLLNLFSPYFDEQLQEFEAVPLPLPTTQNRNKPKKQKENGRFSKEITDSLKAWLEAHSRNPYPSNEEKLKLMEETGLQRSQLNRWFSAARSRLPQPVKDMDNEDDPISLEHVSTDYEQSRWLDLLAQDDMLLSGTDQNVQSPGIWTPWDHDDMHISQDTGIPSLTSQPSTQASTTPSYSSLYPKRGPHFDTRLPHLSFPSSYILTSTALGMLMGCRPYKNNLQNITIEEALPKIPLSRLAPAIFCPGFKTSMAHNSRFLPTISRAISSSWVRNCQGPGLRAKLLELANKELPMSDHGYTSQAGERGSMERLSAVVQVGAWTMMQRKLSDPAVAGRLRWERLDARKPADGDDQGVDEDLLGPGEIEGRLDISPEGDNGMEWFIDDEYMDDDEELLFDDTSAEDQGLLGYFDEMERLAVERLTDEMLFGSEEWEDEGSDMMLLLDGEAEETMLL